MDGSFKISASPSRPTRKIVYIEYQTGALYLEKQPRSNAIG